ncbi:MAG: LysM peptidoglycan-binding domain-containing protein [Shewanella sp.]
MKPQIYIVQGGDSLSLISKKLYGDFSKVDEIAQLNNIKNVDLIYPGQQLTVPNVADAVSTDAIIVEDTKPAWKVATGKWFPWILVAAAAVLLGREAMKQKKKNKAIKAKA